MNEKVMDVKLITEKGEKRRTEPGNTGREQKSQTEMKKRKEKKRIPKKPHQACFKKSSIWLFTSISNGFRLSE
jgi:hypothetical protein